MMTLHQIREALTDRRLDVVSSATGLNRNTIARIRDGKAVDPAYATVKALSDYLTGAATSTGAGARDAS